jgi:medium-chain acyl-[acyl-carrier-protein] hydrolase
MIQNQQIVVQPTDTPWLTIYTTSTTTAPRLRLFCFPYAGGGAAVFRPWTSHLPAEIAVCAVRLPGRETRLREKPFAQMTELVEALAQALQPYLSLPFAFFGHSMGGLTAYELTRYLRQQQWPMPRQLFVSAYRAPHRPAHHPPIHQADTETILSRLRGLNGTPAAFFESQELIDMMLPGIKADFALWETHQPVADEPLPCPISAFGGYEDSEATEADLAAWRAYTRSQFCLRMIAGGHFFINSHRPQILAAVRADLTPYLARPA